MFRKLRDTKLFSFFKQLRTLQIILGLLFSSVLFFILFISIAPNRISVEVGDLAPKDIIATKDIIDEITTKKLKLEAMDSVKPRYIIDLSVQVKVKNDINKLFEEVNALKNEEGLDVKDKLDYLLNNFDSGLGESDYKNLLDSDFEELLKLKNYINDIVNQVMTNGLAKEELETEKINIKKIFDSLDDLSGKLKETGFQIIKYSIKPNQSLDIETMNQKRIEAAESIIPVIIKEGEIIVRKGDKITDNNLELIKKTGLYKEKDRIDYRLLLGLILFVLLVTILIGIYLYYMNIEILNNLKFILLIIIIINTTLLMSRGLYNISVFIIPVSAATMLISILINPKLSILINLIISVLVGFVTGNEVILVLLTIISGTVGAISVVKAQQRHNIFIAGIFVSISNIITIISMGLIYNHDIKTMAINSLYGLLNGIFSSILTIGSLPIWEGLFGIVTQLKLLELSNPNHPLLKRLLLEAPGTYHHSILVANLSEAAAEAVNANALVTRVGSYYHDVGKLKNPYMFKENQFNSRNPHDNMKPGLSFLVITNHVKEGINIARKYKLPLVIENIIKEHHGNTLVKYFYHKALNEDSSKLILEGNFRYEGPKPKTKESALVMLADSVEAAVRSISEPKKEKIHEIVNNIIKDKLTDGQLDECDITLKDLEIIKNSFINILMGIFHERIEYPNLDILELKGVN